MGLVLLTFIDFVCFSDDFSFFFLFFSIAELSESSESMFTGSESVTSSKIFLLPRSFPS